MLDADVLARIDAYWTGFLGCPAGGLRAPGVSVVFSELSPGLIAFSAGSGWVIALTPGMPTDVATALTGVLGLPVPAAEALTDLLARADMREVYGPAQLLYCTPATFQDGERGPARRLAAADAERVERFRQGMGKLSWSLDDVSRWPAAFGLFEGDELVSAAAVQAWAGTIGEVFVDTLPGHRNRGHAKTMTRAATHWILEETTLIPQYDAEDANPASLHVGRAVGYHPYGWLIVGQR